MKSSNFPLVLNFLLWFNILSSQSIKYVNIDELNVRSSPEVKTDNLISKITFGDSVQMIGIVGDWANIQLGNINGFVSNKYLSELKPKKEDNSNFLKAYDPTGKRLLIRAKSIRDLLDSLGVVESDSYSNDLGLVYVKRLSSKPLFIIFLGKEYPLKIKEIIDSYDYKDYLYSYSYYWDLNDMIKNGSLTKEYLQDVFNEPDSKDHNDEGVEFWIYKKYNCRIEFKEEAATSAEVINYLAMQRNELAIYSFDVTGGSYSIGFDITLTNLGKKIIKYSFITVTATNPVDDIVGTKTLKAVGPIDPGDSGSYEFEDIIYSNTAQYLAIDNIKLQYMDGTTKTIPKKEIYNIRIHDWEEIGRRTGDY